MGKVSIGLRGWRFDEEEVFAADGTVRPLDNMPPETRQRILRLSGLIGEPCDACYLLYGRDEVERCRPAQAIYGEPGGEVLLCNAHETDFVYWFQEAGGRELVGADDFDDRFHDWFVEGGHAPEEFGGIEHVEEAPDEVPEAPDPEAALPGIEEEIAAMDDAELDAIDVDLSDLDI